MPDAEAAVARCEESAPRSGLWRHRLKLLTAKAELYLCQGRPELAWPLVEEAERLTGDRSELLPDGALYERLRCQFYLATRGYDAMKTARRVPAVLHDSLVDGMEIRLFEEAVARTAGDSSEHGTPVLDEAVRIGLLGPIARLVANGVHHPGVAKRKMGESAAQLVARVFPDPQRGAVPASIGL